MHLTGCTLRLTLTTLVSCSADDLYHIPGAYRELMHSDRAGDSLKFKDREGNRECFAVDKLDSSILYMGGRISISKSWKEISLRCRLLGEGAKKGKSRYTMTIVKFARDREPSIELRFKSFHNVDVSRYLKIRKDTVRTNEIAFTDYYLFYSHDDSNDPDPVVEIYMKPGRGIIAYKTLSGTWWTREGVIT